MSKSGEIEGLSFYGFDVTPSQFLTFKLRHQSISDKYRLPHVTINSPEELATYEEAVVGDGYEGVITRNPYGSYKQGRSTMTEQGMVKVKRFLDDEAKIVGFEERMHNGNEATTDARGYTVHTSHKANQVPTNALGSLIVTWKGKEFNIGTGFTELERHTMWLNKKFMVGKIVKFKYLPVGMKDLPRHPVFLGMRPEGA
jgi:DNA ligase-1